MPTRRLHLIRDVTMNRLIFEYLTDVLDPPRNRPAWTSRGICRAAYLAAMTVRSSLARSRSRIAGPLWRRAGA